MIALLEWPLGHVAGILFGFLPLAAWLYLLFGRGMFWLFRERDGEGRRWIGGSGNRPGVCSEGRAGDAVERGVTQPQPMAVFSVRRGDEAEHRREEERCRMTNRLGDHDSPNASHDICDRH